MPRTSKVWLSQEQQDDFERFTRSRTLAARLVQRSQILLMAAAHKPDREIAQALGIARQTVALWQERFVEQELAGVERDAPARVDPLSSCSRRLTKSCARPPARLLPMLPTGAPARWRKSAR